MKAKFKLGDSVSVDGAAGEIVEVAAHDANWFKAGNEQQYSVRLEPWEREEEEYTDHEGTRKVRVQFRHPKTGEVRGHEADTLGCVPESSLKARR